MKLDISKLLLSGCLSNIHSSVHFFIKTLQIYIIMLRTFVWAPALYYCVGFQCWFCHHRCDTVLSWPRNFFIPYMMYRCYAHIGSPFYMKLGSLVNKCLCLVIQPAVGLPSECLRCLVIQHMWRRVGMSF